jgi:AraC-like DNA-binding protein/quercetin dioxygenase-like cupin family protein
MKVIVLADVANGLSIRRILPNSRSVARHVIRHTIRFMRHHYDPGPGVSISSLAYEYPAAWQVPEHSHRSDQLIYAIAGVMEVSIAQTRLLVPPLFAVWISANTRHSIRMPNAVSMRTLYLRSGLVQARNCSVLHVAPLLRELILEANRVGDLKTRNLEHAAIRDVLVAQIGKAAPIPTTLAMPDNPRARQLAESTLANPKTTRKLEAQCRDIGMSVRTLQRIYRRELGVDYDTWRRQARLLKAVEMLATGDSIKEVAFAVGYRQASTFVAMFARNFGLTPRAWISAHSPRHPATQETGKGAR